MIAVAWAEPVFAPISAEGTAAPIIERFGGLTQLARALGHKHPTTVQGWKDRGIIPARRQGDVLAAAQRLGIPLAASDFFDQPPVRSNEAA